MTALFEMRIHLGGDPRGFSEYVALCDELAKLNHPACPDVDWGRVEQLCLALLDKNGAELQTVASYTLARSHRRGLDGMVEGLSLIEALGGEWSRLWPPMASGRVDILAWLFAQLQPVLRGVEMTAQSLPALAQLNQNLERLYALVARQTQVPVITLQVLRQQVDSLMQRLAREATAGVVIAHPTSTPAPGFVMPVVILPPLPQPEALLTGPKPRKNRAVLWLLIGGTVIALTAGLWWWNGLASPGNTGSPGLMSLHRQGQAVDLDSLMLFDAASAELKSTSTKVLINALADIKARPGWRIVITGHSDVTGSAEQNLQLSQARAWAVRDWIQRMGDIPDSCFVVEGAAASQPIASNDSGAGRAANRRVDIRLTPEVGC